MTDWEIRNMERPKAFIQWKGTEVCMDVYCPCGEQFHIDDMFVYAVQCPYCEKRLELSCMIELRVMPEEEVWDGCEIRRGEKGE